MKTNSIFFKIRVAFAISSFLILAVFALFYFIQEHYKSMELRERLMHASRATKHLTDEPQEANERLHGLDMELVSGELADRLMSDADKKKLHMPGPVEIFLLEKNDLKYIIVTHPRGSAVFLDKKPITPVSALLFVALLAVLGVLAVFYRSILRGLAPLDTLKTKVEEYAKSGEFEMTDKHLCDEIDALSNAFGQTAKHLNNISKARSLFLRNIAHELKTPLSKGRFLAESAQDEELQERLHTLFAHFDMLINELLQVERLTANGVALSKKECLLQDLLDEAIESGFLDDERLSVDECNKKLFVDFKLFTLAVKNLISNALKHSSGGLVSVKFQDDILSIENTGAPLQRAVEQMSEPFVKGDESSEGLGLGLYIVKQILQLHGAKLQYEYKNGTHRFYIDTKPLSVLSC